MKSPRLKPAGMEDRMKKLVVFFLMALLLVGVVATVSADPVGGCPTDDWNLVTVGSPVDGRQVGSGNDNNGDGYLCYNVIEWNNSTVERIAITVVIDNNTPNVPD